MVKGFGKIKKRLSLTRRQKIGSCLGAACALVVAVGGLAWFLLNQLSDAWPTSTKVTARAVSPDGAYVATVTDWGAGGLGNGSTLEVRPRRPSSFAVRLSRLFAGSYTDSFEQVTGIEWAGRRTLRVRYFGVPGDEAHPTSWGDVHFDNRPIPVN